MLPHKLVDGDAPKVETLEQEVVDEPASDEVEGSRMKVYMTYHIGFRVFCTLRCSTIHALMLQELR